MTSLIQKLGAVGASISKDKLWMKLDRAGLRASSPMIAPVSKMCEQKKKKNGEICRNLQV
jgi:hypothetical protein